MASLQNIKPASRISGSTTPPALREALYHIFSGCGEGLWLVGGTALAGYYAKHRRSDDLDLFAVDETAHRAATLAAKSLKNKGALLTNERTTPNYYHADAQFRGHPFTIDIVLDEHLHATGKAIQTQDKIWVADLPTLFAMKAACLISRCSEKDLFDLDWILSHVPHFEIENLIQAGAQFDGGLNVETLLISLQGGTLHKEACHFLLPKSSMTVAEAYKKIIALRETLIEKLMVYQKKLSLSNDAKALAQAVKDQKKI
ncbi:MAG: nucleotidyl transferase AbiEii/AbiGii toxin family protein [Deltaproteobacteria bacterium]|nr:nucleotidyl transferase AbiEii/AbiGii toxin family protein [Deltaproteobacteria bacterium]